MAEIEKKVLIDVEINQNNAEAALGRISKQMADLTAENKRMKADLKAGEISWKDYSANININNQAIKDLKAQQSSLEGQLNVLTAETTTASGSFKEQARMLADLKNQYASLLGVQRNSEGGKAMLKQMVELDAQVKANDASMGNFQRNVGNYPTVIASIIPGFDKLNGILGTVGSSISDLATKGGAGFAALGKSAVSLGKSFLTPPIGLIVLVLSAIMLAIQKVSAAFKKNNEASTRLSKAMATFQPIVTAIGWAFDKLAIGISYAVEWLVKIGTQLLKLNPIIQAFSAIFPEATKNMSDAEKASQELVTAQNNLKQTERDYTVNSAKRNKEIAELHNEALDKEKYTAKERLNLLQQALDKEEQNLEDEQKIAAEHLRILEAKALQEVETSDDTANKIAEAKARMYNAEENYHTGTMRLQSQFLTAQKEINQEAIERQKKAIEEAKQRADNAFNYAQKMIELNKNVSEQSLKAETQFQNEDFASKANYEKRIFELNHNAEIEKLNLQRKYGKISQKEFDLQNNILTAQATEFQNIQVKNLSDFINTQIQEIQSMIDKDVDAQIADVNKKYADAAKNIETLPEPKQMRGESKEDFAVRTAEYKEFMFNRAAIEIQLERQQAAEIAEIRNSSLQNQISDIEKTYQNLYSADLEKFTDNEREKNKVEIRMLQEQIAAKKAQNLSSATDEAALRSAQSKENISALNTELLNANLSAKQKYDAKKAYLDKELEIYRGNKDKETEIAAAQAENEKELYDSRLEAFNQWSGKVGELLGAMNELANAQSEAEMQKFTEQNEAKKAALQKRLDAGIISQANYDKQVAALDKELDKKQAELQRKQAIRDKAMKLFGVITASIQSIVESAKLGFPAAIPFVAMAAALGAIQTAAIIAQPLPKASKGMLLKGASHAQGGIPIEAEGGEVIINKRSTAMFRPLLSAINQAGGGVPFNAQNQIIAGQMLRRYTGTSTDSIVADRILQGIANQKIYVAMDEFQQANKNYINLTDSRIL